MKNIINLTPHDVNIVGGETMYKATGVVARCKQLEKEAGEVNGIKLYTVEYGEVEGLPEEKEDTFYIVSQLVRSALPDRKDLLSPAGLVRDEAGRIIGSTGFYCN